MHFKTQILLNFKKKRSLFLLVLLTPLILMHWRSVPALVIGVPAKHADFVGRGCELAALKKQLLSKPKGSSSTVSVITGEGGIGKTELVIAFANDHLKDFSFIGWIDGSSEESLVHSYAKIGDYLDIREEHPQRCRERVHQKLEYWKGKPWLLILDDLREIPSGLPKMGGAVLITCRDKGMYSPELVLELSKDRNEALLLLSKLTGQANSNELEYLAEQLDFLPLMINLAGHYIAETPGISFSNYSDLLTQNAEVGPLKWIEFRKRYPKSLAATYMTTLQMLECKHPLSVEFLKDASFLHHKNIPEELLTSWLEEKKIYSSTQIPFIKGDILRELSNHSLIRYDEGKKVFSIHQLFHQTLNLEREEEENGCIWLDIFKKLEAVARYNPTQKESIRPFQRVLPHCLRVLDQQHSIPLALIVARYFIDTELHVKKGGRYLDLAQDWSRELSHPVRGRIAFLQGMLQLREADMAVEAGAKHLSYLRALELFDTALDIFQKQSDNHLYLEIEQNPKKCSKEYQRAICMQYQGQTLRFLGGLEDAERRLEEALAAFQSITEEHFDIARIMREQALIIWEKGGRDEAIAKLKEAIGMQKRVYGDTYLFQPAVAATHRILGNFLLESGDYKNADQAYALAMTINQTVYQSTDHPFQVELLRLRAKAQEALCTSR